MLKHNAVELDRLGKHSAIYFIPRSVDSISYSVYLHSRYQEALMKSRVQKWGNSLALRIPKSFPMEAGVPR